MIPINRLENRGILFAAGARPNFMKIAPLLRECRKRRFHNWKLVHTGQHYDYRMSRVFFKELEIPRPDYYLNAGSGEHAEQTAKIMIGFEKVCRDVRPDTVVVVGDVNSTLACAVVAKKMGILLAHVESGLRSFDMGMPEEINRIVTDRLSDYLFVSEKSGIINLRKEGVHKEKIHFVGNVMIDTLMFGLERLKKNKLHGEREKGVYAVVTLHRPSNVDNRRVLAGIISVLGRISKDMDVYFPVHPRTLKNMKNFGLFDIIKKINVTIMEPLSYLDFLSLWKDAGLVLTDSGGIQEETTVLGIPCFTLRENTERPITVSEGTNTVTGVAPDKILGAYVRLGKGLHKKRKIPALWDGKTAGRIMDVLLAQKGERCI